MQTPISENQGYRDRLKRAEAWIERAGSLKEQNLKDLVSVGSVLMPH